MDGCQKLLTGKRKRDTCIDTLPDAVLGIILSSLPVKEAARTSVLCRRWRYLYLWNFNLVFELKHKRLLNKVSPNLIQVSEFVEWVNQVMAKHQGPLVDKLIIRLWGTQVGYPYIGSTDVCRRNDPTSLITLICYWISFAMQKKVRVFELASFGDNKQPAFQMEQCSCQTREIFSHYDFPDLKKFLFLSRAMEPNGSLVSLTYFRLVNIHIKDEIIEYFLSNCPFLEELCITGSKYLSNLNIVSASLKSLSVCNCRNLKSMEISAANLVSFEYIGHLCNQPLKGSCSNKFPLLSIRLVHNALLQSVRLVNLNIKDEMMEYLLFNCRHLEKLYIKGAKYLSNLNVVSASLKSLSICYCAYLENLKISAANLVSFEYMSPQPQPHHDPGYLGSLKSWFQDVPRLSELIIDYNYMESFISKKQLHGIYYNHLEKLVLNLPNQALEVMWVCPKSCGFPLLRCLKHLEVGIAIIPGKSLLFCVLWAKSCPLLSTFRIQLHEEYSKLLVSSYHENQRKSAYEKLNLNFYRHEHLKRVKLIDFTGHDNYIEFAMDLLQIGKSSLDKLIVKIKDDPEEVAMFKLKDYYKYLKASLPAGAEFVIRH